MTFAKAGGYRIDVHPIARSKIIEKGCAIGCNRCFGPVFARDVLQHRIHSVAQPSVTFDDREIGVGPLTGKIICNGAVGAVRAFRFGMRVKLKKAFP